MEIELLSIAQAALIPIVIALVEGLKKVFPLGNYAFLVSLVLGIAGAFVFPGPSASLTVLSGIVMGLSASGLYTGGRNTKNSLTGTGN